MAHCVGYRRRITDRGRALPLCFLPMKDIGSVNYQPQTQPRETVAFHRAERPVERETVSRSRTPVIETRQNVESRGREETVTDSHGDHLYKRTAAKVFHTSDDLSRTVQYTSAAERVTTHAADESRTLLDMRA